MSSTRPQWLLGPWIILALVFFWGLFYFLQLSAHPLGVIPVLDGRENLQYALQLREMNAWPEPFYRAMFYPLIISLLFPWADSPESLLPMAQIMGLALHLLNTALIGIIAGRWWGERSGMMARILYGFYPIALFYALEPLDITLAVTWLLSGIFMLTATKPGKIHFGACGIFTALGVITRPHILFLIPVFFLSPWLLKHPLKTAIPLMFTGLCLPLLGYGLWQKNLSGEFAILPTQGAYNLYAANQPGAHGRYYVQKISIEMDSMAQHHNPARLESIYLYRKAHPDRKEVPSQKEMNAYWRSQFVNRVFEDPASWLIQLSRKGFWFFHTNEIYNNRTYSFQAKEFPILGFNPANFGFILVLAASAWIFFPTRKAGLERNKMIFPSLLTGALAAGCTLTLVSGRFRFLVVPLLILIASKIFSGNKPALSSARVFALVAITLLTFWPWPGYPPRETWVADQRLLDAATEALEPGPGES